MGKALVVGDSHDADDVVSADFFHEGDIEAYSPSLSYWSRVKILILGLGSPPPPWRHCLGATGSVDELVGG
jgi:hypothetical protein